MITAFSAGEWDNAAHCGECVKLTSSEGKSIVVRIIDQCPGCYSPHLFDLSKDAFAALVDPSVGRVMLNYEFVPCSYQTNIVYKVLDNSNSWWMSVIIHYHNVGIAKFELKGKDGDWVTVDRVDYNEFIYRSGGTLQAPLSFRVTGINGEVITDENIVTNNDNYGGHYTSSGQFTGTSSASTTSFSFFLLLSSALLLLLL